MKKMMMLVVLVGAVAALSIPSWSADAPAAAPAAAPATTQPAASDEKTYNFDSNESLADWKLSGAVSIDASKAHGDKGAALKVGPGGKAVLKLRDKAESGKISMWVFDDGTKPEDPKANRNGPRWGLTENGETVFVVGILYAKYLGGDAGYTASTSTDGKKWVSNIQWLGGKRDPAWHKWTFDFDAEKGLRLFVDDKEMVNQKKPRLDWNKADVKGFTGVVIYGDGGKGNEQTLYVDDVSVTLGGPMKATPTPPAPKTPASSPAAK